MLILSDKDVEEVIDLCARYRDSPAFYQVVNNYKYNDELFKACKRINFEFESEEEKVYFCYMLMSRGIYYTLSKIWYTTIVRDRPHFHNAVKAVVNVLYLQPNMTRKEMYDEIIKSI